MSADDVADDLHELWADLEQRAMRREPRTIGLRRTFRCRGCKSFLRGPDVRCERCGYDHGHGYSDGW